MSAPDNVQALQSFFGFANFYLIFIKNMQNLRAPLNELLKTKPEAGHQNAKLHSKKKTLTSDLSLTHYGPKLNILGAGDVSTYGIGACILHKLLTEQGKPLRMHLNHYYLRKSNTFRSRRRHWA